MRDIDYFSHDEMDRNIVSFVNSLPEHLKNHFSTKMEDTGHHWYDSVNILEEHSTSGSYYGVKSITFRYDLSPHINWIPILGSIVYGISKANPIPAVTFYFDSGNGEVLSENEANNRRENNRRAENSFEKGKSHERNGNFTQAHEEYQRAVNQSSHTYENRNKFINHRDQVKVEVDFESFVAEGDREMVSGNWDRAKSKYESALRMTRKQTDLVRNRIRNVEKEINANQFKIQGDTLFNMRNFKGALEAYTNARNKSQLQKSKYESYINKAQNELNASNAVQLGDDNFEQQRYEKAVQHFQRALSISENSNNSAFIRTRLQKAEAEVRAIDLKNEGDQFFAANDFNRALQKYEAAQNTTNMLQRKASFTLLTKNARREIGAASSAKSAQQKIENGDFEAAEHEIISAFLSTKTQEKKAEYKALLDSIRISKAAASEKEIGDEAYQAGDYEYAKEKYARAFLLSKNADEKNTYRDLLQSANIEIDVNTMKNHAVQELTQENLQRAKNLIKNAITLSEHDQHKEELEIVKQKIVNELEAKSHADEAQKMFNEANFEAAKLEMLNALKKSQLQSKSSSYTSFLAKVQVELRALNDKELGDSAYNVGNYQNAKESYTKAYLSTKHPEKKENYKLLLSMVNNELDVDQLQNNAINAVNVENFDEATTLLQSALSLSEHNIHKEQIQSELNRVKNEISVQELVQDANQLFALKQYKAASKKFQEAKQRTTREAKRAEIIALQEKCETEVEAQNLRKRGDEFFNQENYDHALQHYQSAFEKSNVDTEKNTFTALIEAARTELDVSKETKLGDAALKDGKVDVALAHYTNAKNLTKIEKNRIRLAAAIETVEKMNEAIASGKLKTGEAALNNFQQKLQQLSKSLEEGINLRKQGESQVANEKIEEALKSYEDAGNVLITGLNVGTVVILEQLKQITVQMKEIEATEETSVLLDQLRTCFDNYIKQTQALQSENDQNESVNYESRLETEQQQLGERKVITNLESSTV